MYKAVQLAFWRLLFLLAITIAFPGCKDDEEYTDIDANRDLLYVMEQYYLWYNQLPNLNPENYKNPVEFMEALRVNPPDRWSYVTTKAEHDAYYDAGAYYGYGFGSGFDQEGNLYITLVFDSSPFKEKGIDRGWRILSIDGVTPTPENYSELVGPNEAGITKTFRFLSPQGEEVSYTFSKIEVIMNTILYRNVFNFGDRRVGYFVLDAFITPTEDELNACFSGFLSQGVNELIVDLRYNGGGQVSTAGMLGSLIGGTKVNGKVFAKYIFNDKNTNLNRSVDFILQGYALNLNRVVFITSGGTASASELVINGLKPYMPVALVGTKTHGKPVGMYSFYNNKADWVYLPVIFTSRNANNEGDYYDGIAVNVEAEDDFTRPFGDLQESSLHAALVYLGVVSPKGIKTTARQLSVNRGKGLYEEIGAW